MPKTPKQPQQRKVFELLMQLFWSRRIKEWQSSRLEREGICTPSKPTRTTLPKDLKTDSMLSNSKKFTSRTEFWNKRKTRRNDRILFKYQLNRCWSCISINQFIIITIITGKISIYHIDSWMLVSRIRSETSVYGTSLLLPSFACIPISSSYYYSLFALNFISLSVFWWFLLLFVDFV